MTNGCLSFYAIPNELDCLEDYDRRYHLDLSRLTDADLWSEHIRVRIALAHALADPRSRHWSDWDCAWLRERVDLVRRELRRRAVRPRRPDRPTTNRRTIKVQVI